MNAPLIIVIFFTWETGREFILTINKLMKRGRIMANDCYLCEREAKSCNHILLWCPTMYKLWTMVYELLGISWVIVGSIRDKI